MNRILFERDEIRDGIATFGGVRAEHVLQVLHGEVGQILKTGEVNGLVGTSEIIGVGDRRRCTKEEDDPSVNLNLQPQPFPCVTVRCNHNERSLSPWVDLILAPPRPRVMKRLLPQLATLGVGRIFLVGAKKVEKDFWGATLLKEENYRPLLIDGLMQAGTSVLPTLGTRRNFRKFVTDELDALFPASTRIVAHPHEVPSAECRVPGAKCLVPSANMERHLPSLGTKHQALGIKHQALGTLPPLLAIGPEGGWTDEEVVLLEEHGFARYSLGSRILRTDTATIALLAQLMRDFDK